MWNRKRWIRYSTRDQMNMPSRNKKGKLYLCTRIVYSDVKVVKSLVSPWASKVKQYQLRYNTMGNQTAGTMYHEVLEQASMKLEWKRRMGRSTGWCTHSSYFSPRCPTCHSRGFVQFTRSVSVLTLLHLLAPVWSSFVCSDSVAFLLSRTVCGSAVSFIRSPI